MSQISLQSALDRVNATLQRERQAGHDDLRRILRQSRHNPQAIAEVQLQHGQDLFEALAGIVETERLAYLKSFKSTTKSATSTTSSRLAAASASYRFAIEVCGKSILWSKAKECLIHLTESFSDDQNGICEPIALDNVKAINEILSHQPHLDHVPTKLWKLLCKFAVSHLDQQCSSSTRTTNGSSSARTNSNSSLTQSQSSQIRRLNSSTQKHLSAEFARMVRYLTATTSVPVYAVADLLTGSLLRSLRQASIPGSPEVDLLMALNHVLIRSDTEVTQMLKLRTPDLIQTIEQLWDELLNSLVLLLPFIKAALNSETADNTQDFRQQIQSILDSLLQDYSGRSQKDLLSFDDVRLVVTSNASAFDQSTLSLSSDNDEAYRNWSMLLLAAHLLNNLYPEDQPVNSGTEDLRSQKRLRKESRSYTLIRMSRDPSPTKSQAGLQLIAMYCQVGGLNEEEIQDVVLYLKQLLNDEKPTIAAWASVALASGNKSIMLMESKWYSQIYGVLPTIDIADMSQSNLDDDDLNGGDDSDFESAPRKPANGATRQASQSTSISTAKDIASAACGRLYTKLLSGLAEKDERPLEPFMDELQSMTSDEKVAGRDIIIRMKEFGAELDEKSAFDILDHLCEEVLQQSYAQSHSGIAKAFVIRFWAASFDQWIFATDRKLQDVSVDIYDDCLRSLTEHDLDIEAQTILSDVLVKMWQQNENFAQNDMFAQDDTGPPSSPRTAVIQIISEGCTLAKHHLTSKMPAVFSCYSMSVHDALYDDLEKSLPNDADSTDAIAMRIEFLASLGSQWKSLLRRVVWHIFDAAGQVPACVGHAAQAVRKICNSHGFKDGPSLFRLFCTQLTYTWQTERSLSDVPFTIFEYDSLHDLIQDNQEELVAQSHLFNKTGDLDMIKETLQMDLADLIRASFVTTFTYAMAHDVSQTPQSQSLANHESTLREHLNKDEVISLFRQHLPQLIAKSIISTHVDGSIERALEKRSHMDNARQALAAMKGFASDAREPPPALQPSFKIRHFFDFLERLARRVGRKSQDLFSGPLFVSTLRTVLDSLDDCLGSLHARTIVLKIRLLCALGEKALDLRYAIEVLVRNLRPLLDDQNCADDAAGIMHHLFTRARKCIPQASENLSGIVCQAILTVDLLRRGMIRPSTLLNSQSQTTKSNMHKLSTWLIEYVASLDCDIHDRHKATFQGISSTFGEIQYPAEFRRDSKASHYLLALLDDTKASRPFMDEGDRFVLIRCLIENSAGAPLGDDVFQKHSAASRYATSAWRATKKLRLPEAVSEWLGRALGRSYSLSGPAQARRMLPVDESEIYARPKNFSQAIQASRLAILRKLLEFISDGDTAQASVAERALRTIISAFASADDLESVQSLLPEHVFAALNMSATTSKGSRSKHPKAGHPFANGNALSKHGAYSINSLAQQAVSSMPSEPTAEPLLSVVGTVDDFAESIIGPLWHLGLCVVEYEGQSARKSFSETASLAFQQDASSDLAKHIILVLMYLLRQPVEKEGTRVERLEWLDVDYITAARIAMSCGMPKHALLLVEIAPRVVQQNRSSRRSSSQAATGHADIPHDLLLTIFDSIDDPDSFYAVARAPSFDNILKRVDREANPLKSLVLHSAYMDASKRAGVGADMVHNSNALTAISNMNLNTMTQILLEHSREDGIDAPETAMTMSRKLYEWDIQITDAKSTPQSILFGAFQQLSNVPNASAFQNSLGAPLSQSLRILADADLTRDTATSALHALTVLSDMQSLTDCTSASNAFALQSELTSLQSSWDVGQYAELIDLVSNRESLFGTLRRNTALLADLRISVRDGYLLEAQSVLQTAEASRDLGGKQGSLGAATYINRLVEQCKEQGLQIEVAAVRELASVLWIQDEPEVSIQMLQSLVSAEHSKQDISVDRASLLSQLGHEIAEARLEKPGDIIDKYLKPALHSLNKSSTYQDAANVYFEFASFCDQQLQNPDNEEEFKNLIALKASKEKEQEELRKLDKTVSDKNDKIEVRRRYNKAKQWYELDNQEYLRMLRVRNELVTQALSNYLRALAASEKHDSYVVRFFALWLDHDDSDEAQSAVAQCLKDVPSWKFVTLLNQIMSRLQATEEKFQRLLAGLVGRICGEHPYHSIYHLFASVNVKVGPNDSAAKLRKQAAEKIAHDLKSSKKTGELVSNVWAANSLYHNLAGAKVDTGRAMKFSIQQVPAAKEMNKRIPPMHIPPATLHLKIRPRADYRDVPYIARFREELSIASGLSAPKVLTARSSDGKDYKMLFKGGNDDLRQDAIMEQVFSSVSSMLRNHTDTRRRNLHIRTYVVLPLTHTSGIIEFVPNSLPLHDFVVPAHQRYHPTDMHPDQARSAIKKVQESNRETRIKTYQNVTSKYSPVLRHFFFERFETPQVWFEKRTAYARSTAAISILGHVLGLGDRHCHNILLDELSGEVIHIDLGVAFEMGRVLPVPEVVPFRLTRDIVDGFGIAGVEGVFRRCCEFTLQALREEKSGIMTLLNVLRYDPLYSWTVSPLRAKRMMDEKQDAVEGKKEEGPAEAERALAVVEKKLGRALSVKATVAELIQVAGDERNLAVLFAGWAAYS
ncbi:Serine/threonine-protein kinase tel1-like protein [Elsinoe fawcettii]|nr:Serine/threonine-protein kinase tel1-like protein [Elsinoe fawcettii]